MVLVTGANRGLGLELMEAAIAAGARKVYAAVRDPKQLAALVERSAGRVEPLALDITDERSLAAAEKAPDVSVLFNNADVLASYNVLTATSAQMTHDFATNFFGTLAATKACLPALERAAQAGPAAIVNVLSVESLANVPALARPGVEVHEKAVRAAVQEARVLARWPVDEPAALFFAFAARPRAVPALNASLAVFLAREQALTLGLILEVSDSGLRALLTDVRSRVAGYEDVRAWFASRLPVN